MSQDFHCVLTGSLRISPSIMRGMPPQAYSKQDILKAMEWLEKQSDQVRSQATNADVLMGMYKKALIYGDSFIDKQSPISGESFKNELKGIAEQLGGFDEAPSAKISRKVSEVSPISYHVEPETEAEVMPASNNHDVIQKENIKISIQRQLQTKDHGFNLSSLDSVTQSRVKEVRARFNLSRDEEALRMLISIGYEKLQKI